MQIQNKKADLVKESLRSSWKKEQLFALRQGLELWETYQQKIADCDRELAGLLQEMNGPQPPAGGRGNAVVVGPVLLAPAKSPGKNAPVIERLQELVARLCGGRDVTQIPGLSVYLVLQLISEVGTDMARWPSEKHFASWLGLAGGRKQSGKRKGRVKAHRNRAGRMFCAAAMALGFAACRQGKRVRFMTTTGLVTQLLEQRETRTLPRLPKQLERLDVLVLDELGYIPFSKTGAELLFDVVSRAYERTSLIVTTKLPFEQWTEVMGRERLTGALLDRLTHRVHILEANGESYRLTDAKRRLKRK